MIKAPGGGALGENRLSTVNCCDRESEWNAWLEANAARFLLFARQQTRSQADAEDVLQEALVETWRRAGGRPDNALVFATIRRRAIDLGRRTGRRLLREAAAAENSPQWLAPAAGDDGMTAELERAMKQLPPAQCEVITLKIHGSLTFAEIARVLGIPQGTAASRYRLAIDSLRQILHPILT